MIGSILPNETKVMKFPQSYSYWIPRVGRFATAIFVTLIVMSILPHVISARETNLLNLAQFFLWSALGVYMAYTLAGWSTSFAEMAIDSWSEVSYIKLNRGDQIEIAKNQKENRGHLLKGACGGLGMLIVDVVAHVTATIVVGFAGSIDGGSCAAPRFVHQKAAAGERRPEALVANRSPSL